MEVGGQLHALAALPGERAVDIHWIAGCVDPRAGSDVVARIKIPGHTGNRTQVQQHITMVYYLALTMLFA
jgi:hypothetical protein